MVKNSINADSNKHNIASVLDESLPYIQRFTGKTIVVKYGGNAMTDTKLKNSFARDIVLLKLVGANPIVVHGGGPQIGNLLSKIGKKSKFYQGMRITDSETMDVVEMVLGGLVNKEIVSLINNAGGKAVGLTGKDGALITAKKLKFSDSDLKVNSSLSAPEIIDLGHVGLVKEVQTGIIDNLINGGFIPVIAPIGVGDGNLSYNINADLVSSEIAKSMQAEKLILLTNVTGVLNANNKLIVKINTKEAKQLIKKEIITGGMLPKVNCSLDAVKGCVKGVHVIDGRVEHAVILEMFTDKGIGTMFY